MSANFFVGMQPNGPDPHQNLGIIAWITKCLWDDNGPIPMDYVNAAAPYVVGAAAVVLVKQKTGLLCVDNDIVDEDGCFNPVDWMKEKKDEAATAFASISSAIDSYLHPVPEVQINSAPATTTDIALFEAVEDASVRQQGVCYPPSEITKAYYGVVETTVVTPGPTCGLADGLSDLITVAVSSPPPRFTSNTDIAITGFLAIILPSFMVFASIVVKRFCKTGKATRKRPATSSSKPSKKTKILLDVMHEDSFGTYSETLINGEAVFNDTTTSKVATAVRSTIDNTPDVIDTDVETIPRPVNIKEKLAKRGVKPRGNRPDGKGRLTKVSGNRLSSADLMVKSTVGDIWQKDGKVAKALKTATIKDDGDRSRKRSPSLDLLD